MSGRSRPVRICTGCGERKEKGEMVRIVADPAGTLVPDLKGRLPSRGAYVCPEADCILTAAAGRLAASLRMPPRSGPDAVGLQEAVAQSYRDRVAGLIGQARKSGKVASGTNIVEGELRRRSTGRWFAVLAKDVSEDIKEKLVRNLDSASVPYRIFLSKEELGGIVGKSPRSVVLIKDEGLAGAIAESMDRCIRVSGKGGS